MLHQLATQVTTQAIDQAVTHAGSPGAVVWAAAEPHVSAFGDAGAASGAGVFWGVGALLSPVLAVLLAGTLIVVQWTVMSSSPWAGATMMHASAAQAPTDHPLGQMIDHVVNPVMNHLSNHAAIVWAAGGPNPKMDPNGLPGGDAASKIVGGLMFYGLLACAAAIVLGVMAFTAGKILTNHYAGVTGRIAVLAGIIGAVFIGGCMTLVNWAFNLGASFTPQ